MGSPMAHCPFHTTRNLLAKRNISDEVYISYFPTTGIQSVHIVLSVLKVVLQPLKFAQISLYT